MKNYIIHKYRDFIKENNSTVDEIELIKYMVDAHSDNDIQSLYYGFDYDEAKKEFDTASPSDLHENMVFNIMITFRSQKDIYEFKPEDIDDNIEDYPIEEYYEDKRLYRLKKEGEWEEIDNRPLETNEEIKQREDKETYELWHEGVIDHIKKLSSSHKWAAYLDSTFYALVPCLDGFIKVRVADHFFNPAYIHLGKNINEDREDKPINIYGFLSIHILRNWVDYKKDRRGFRADFKYNHLNSKHKNLIAYLTYSVTDDNNLDDIIEDIDYDIHIISQEIDNVIKSGLYDKKDDDGDYLEIEY